MMIGPCMLLFASAATAQSATTIPAPVIPVPASISAPSPVPAPKLSPAVAAAPSVADLMKASAERQRASMDAQRASVRQQAETLGVRLPAWTPVAPPAGIVCEPLPDSIVAPLVEGAAKSQNVEPGLLRAVIEQESGLRPCAVSPKGAEGLMQLMPQTVEDLGVHDPFDPKENVEAGARFLKQLLDKYKGDIAQALGAYNAGSAAADLAGGVPDIMETRDYVNAILKKLGK